MRPIRDMGDIEAGLAALTVADSRLAAAFEAVDEVPLRLARPGFAGLASIIVSQQVSRASADAIFARLQRLVSPLDAEAILVAEDRIFREAGLSRPKQRTLVHTAQAVCGGELDLLGVCRDDADGAMAALCAVKGIGPWTAEIYLMFCAGHADIFPAGDLALQEAARMALRLASRPNEKSLRELANAWTPWRSVAARLLWAYYRSMKAGRDAMPL